MESNIEIVTNPVAKIFGVNTDDESDVIQCPGLMISRLTNEIYFEFNCKNSVEIGALVTYKAEVCERVVIKHLDENSVLFQVINPYYNLCSGFGPASYDYVPDNWKEKLIQMLLSKQLQQ